METIVVGVSSGIAAFKVLDLVKVLRKRYRVIVLMTPSAKEMVRESEFRRAGAKVASQLFPKNFDYRKILKNRKVEHIDIADSAVVARYIDSTHEAARAKELALVDLSTLPRSGLKGRESQDWLIDRGYDIPEEPNLATRQADDALMLRLSREEFLLLPNLADVKPAVLDMGVDAAFTAGRRVYSLIRGHSHCWFALTGQRAVETFAKLCGIDLRPIAFKNGQIAQTSVARVSAIVCRADISAVDCFYILSDVSAAEYLWEALLDAMQEFGGCPVGIIALQALSLDTETNHR